MKLVLILLIFFLASADALTQENNCEAVSPACGNTPTPFFSDGNILWIAFEQDGHVYVTSSNNLGKSFQTPVAVNNVPEEIYTNGENRPKIVLDSQQRIFVSWTKKTPGRFSGDIRFSRSTDLGKTFSAPITVNTDNQLIGHRFDALAVNKKDQVFITWFDKRDQAAAKRTGNTYTGTALYYAQSDNHGVSFSENIKLADHTCECCRIALDFDQQDQLYAFWRHIFNTNTRDHALIAVPPKQPIKNIKRTTVDDWHIDACPHHGPDLAIDTDNRFHLAWFTQGEQHKGILYGRASSAENDIELQHLMDGSAGASHPQVLSHADKLYYVWKRFSGEDTKLLLSLSTDQGVTWSEEITLAHTNDSSDHPLLIENKSNIYASWLTKEEGYRLIPINSHAYVPYY